MTSVIHERSPAQSQRIPIGDARLLRARSPQPFDRQKGSVPWLLLIVLLGLALRSYHYLSDPPVWHDEAVLIYNVLHKDYNELLGPLYYSEACPPLFLALEKAVVLLLGDSTYALRLLPYLASCVSLVVLILLARPLLPRQGLLWFALLLACSDRLLWHGSEAKPYAVDVLVATFVLAMAARIVGARFQRAQDPGPDCDSCFPRDRDSATPALNRLLLTAALVSPLLTFLAFPTCFLLGGLALTLLPTVWRSRSRSTWPAFVCYGGLCCGSFVLLMVTAVQAQKDELMVACWADKFPPWSQPWLVPPMMFVRLTELVRYAAEPAGNALAVLAVIGGIALWRAGQTRLVGLLVWPIALNAIAWLLGSYPLGALRVDVYAVPALLLLIAAGITPALAWLARWGRLAPLGLVALLMVPVGQAGWVFIKPWERLDSKAPTAYVLEHRTADEPVVGLWWEQTYYCRRLGPLYRMLVTRPQEPPSLPPEIALNPDGTPSGNTVKSLWLLSFPDAEAQAAHAATLKPSGAWHVVERHVFRDIVVLRVARH